MKIEDFRKVVAITGASGGIGEATARLLAREGMRVMLGARRTERLQALVDEIRAEGGSADFHTVDVTDADDVQSFVLAAHRKFGQVDVLVNNAGIMPLSPLDHLKLKEWDQMIDVNIRGVLYVIAAALPLMQVRGTGQIINVTGDCAPGPRAAVYSATKSAVSAISASLRQEVGSSIRVTVVSPGGASAGPPDDTPEAVARAILFAIGQPVGVEVNEIAVQPAACPY